MIKHHPKFELIQSFVNGDLPASLSAAITIHANICTSCQSKITQLTEHVAEASFEQGIDQHISTGNLAENNVKKECVSDVDQSLDEVNDFDFDDMIATITQCADIDEIQPSIEKTVEFKNKIYALPKVLNNIEFSRTAQIGKLARTRLMLDEDEIHTNLLHIEPGGSVPEHTHKGFELTLLLEGSFSDDNGEYVKGDFIMLDGSHKHHPVSNEGCLCYTVANDALHFTQGINKLLNPIGSFIY
jgi:putative transcriptional regulator